jgi:glycosyltransferase involved in cell wall biosynthesis
MQEKHVSKPLISVIIPAYNRAKTIRKAIESLRVQTYTNWEAIVVDDGSTDNTCDIVSEIARHDQRVRLLRHEHNRKAQAARNTGIRTAKGEWIAFLDSDDEYLPESIQDRLTLAEKEHVPVVHSECYILKPGEEKQLYKIRPLSGNIYKDVLEKEGPVFPALLVKKTALEGIGLLDEQIKSYQEWDTAIRLAKNNRFAFCPKPTFIYDYCCDDSMSRDPGLNGKGYEQIFHKHYVEIWKNLGMKGLAYHYGRIGKWYEESGDLKNAGRYKLMAAICKCLSVKMIFAKLSSLTPKKAWSKAGAQNG